MPANHALSPSGHASAKAGPDLIFESFDADRRKMSIGPNVTRQARDELMYRAGWAASKAHTLCTASQES